MNKEQEAGLLGNFICSSPFAVCTVPTTASGKIVKQIINQYLPVDHVVLPSAALLDPNTTPLGLGQKAALGQSLG